MEIQRLRTRQILNLHDTDLALCIIGCTRHSTQNTPRIARTDSEARECRLADRKDDLRAF